MNNFKRQIALYYKNQNNSKFMKCTVVTLCTTILPQ